MFFQCCVVPGCRKVGLLKRQVRRWLFSRDMKNCGPVWREASSKSKFAPRKMMGSGHFLKFRCRKNDTWLWRETHLQAKMHKIPAFWSTFGGFSVAKGVR